MKNLLLLVLLAAPLRAALLARVATTKGEIVTALQYDKAPQAVANFITLAQGTRAHLDPATGALSYKPYYIGEKFFRIVKSPGFEIAQTGSGTGTNSGGPGFNFKDEFTPALRHVPYVLSMANSGPNSNGSQIFFTGNTSIPSLDDVHTIFGLVTDPASRATVDAILTAGSDGSSITGITFERTDPAAVAFNEFAQNLPIVTQPRGNLSVTRNVAAKWALAEPLMAGDIFRAFRSTTLAPGSWAELTAAEVQLGILPVGGTYNLPPLTLDNATNDKEFFNLSFTRHPGSVTPTALNTRFLTIEVSGGRIEYHFNISASGGSAVYTPDSGSALPFSFSVLSFDTTAHAFSVIVENLGINPRYLLIKAGCDSATPSQIDCHHSTSASSGGAYSPFASGPAAVTR